MKHSQVFFVVVLQCMLSISVEAESGQWSQFRGPNGAGLAAACRPPFKITAGQPSWKTPLPPGKSSPVLWEDRIFLTCVEGKRLAVLALDKNTGDVLWKRVAPEVPFERVHRANSVAVSTPCVDARRVYVYFGSYGLLCYDHEGQTLWTKPIPTPRSLYGVATSPIVHDEQLILVLDDDANLEGSKLSRSKVMALDCKTGETVWETPRPYNRSAWSSPMVWTHAKGTELVVLGNGRVSAYNLATGEELWYATGFSREPIAVPVAGNGHLYVSVSMRGGRGDAQLDPKPFWQAMLPFDQNGDGQIAKDEITKDFTLPFRPELPLGHPGFGFPLPDDPAQRRKRQEGLFDWRDKNKDGVWTEEEFSKDMKVGSGRPLLMAIRPGGQGDVTETHVTWELNRGIPEIPSPILHRGRLYLVRAGGVLSCINAETGDMIYRERLGASGPYNASPVIANDHLYLFSNKGVFTAVKCGDEFSVTHQVDLDAAISATPGMDQDSLYVRTDEALVAFR